MNGVTNKIARGFQSILILAIGGTALALLLVIVDSLWGS